MSNQRFLLPVALALAMTAANAQQAPATSNAGCDVVINDASLPAELRQAVKEQRDIEDAERLLKNQKTAANADAVKTNPVDIKQQSCYDKYANYKIIVGVGYPVMDKILEAIMDQLKKQACQIVDQTVNGATGQVNGAINGAIGGVTGGIPGMGGAGNVNIGVGSGNARGSTVNTGSDRVSIGTQGRDTSGGVAGSVGNRVGRAATGIFR